MRTVKEFQSLTTREAIVRLRNDGYNISEYALRKWIRAGSIPVRHIGKKALLYYPNIISFLQCVDGQDNDPSTITENGIRKVDY